MAVTYVCRTKEIAGQFSDKDELTETYEVRTDDPNDGPYTILAIQGNPAPGPDTLPTRGTLWNWGNDSGGATCRNLSMPELFKSEPSGNTYYVKCNYLRESIEPGEPTDQGTKAFDPDDVKPQLFPGYRSESIPVDKAEFLGYFNNAGTEITPAGATMVKGEEYPIQNSALVPFLPVPEILKTYETVSVRGYYRPWNFNLSNAVDSTNLTEFQIDYKDGTGESVFDKTYPIGTLLLKSVNVEPRGFGPRIWFWTTIEFWHDPNGFDWSFLDKGITKIVDPAATPIEWEAIKKDNGEDVAEEVPLNGAGDKLATPLSAATHVYLRYRVREKYEFGNLGIKL